jgi:hypothetical protein
MVSGQCCTERIAALMSAFHPSETRANDRRNTRRVCHELVTALSFPLCGNAHLQENGTLSPDKAFFNYKSTAICLAFCQENPHSRVPGAAYSTSARDADRVRIAHLTRHERPQGSETIRTRGKCRVPTSRRDVDEITPQPPHQRERPKEEPQQDASQAQLPGRQFPNETHATHSVAKLPFLFIQFATLEIGTIRDRPLTGS